MQPFPSWQVYLPDAGTPPTYDRQLRVAGAVSGLASLALLSLSTNGLGRCRWVESLRGSEEGPEPSTQNRVSKLMLLPTAWVSTQAEHSQDDLSA